MFQRLAVVAAVTALAAHPALAQPLGTAFTYQGELRSGGTPASGLHDLRFRLYDAAAGGAQVGATLCTENLSVTEGRFAAQLDFGAQFAGQQQFLEIEVRADTGLTCADATGYTVLGPRQALTAAPNALFALNATRLDGQGAAFYQNASNLTTGTLSDTRLPGNVAFLDREQYYTDDQHFSARAFFDAAAFPFEVNSTGLVTNLNADLLDGLSSADFLRSTTPLALSAPSATHVLLVQNTTAASGVSAIRGEATNPIAPGGVGVYGQSAGPAGSGVYGESTATSGFGVQGHSAGAAGRGVFGNAAAAAGVAYGVYGQSASTSGVGVYGQATAPTGGTYGAFFRSDSTSGVGVLGSANAGAGVTSGVYGQSLSTQGRGVFGRATAATGAAYGVQGVSDSADGRGVYGSTTTTSGAAYGVYGESVSATGRGVYGFASAATSYGVYGLSDSGRGVYGESSAPTGNTEGVVGVSRSPTGFGVVGRATSASGLNHGVTGTTFSTAGQGVLGNASAATGVNYGVYGLSLSATGWGVWAQGRSGASGTKSFRIDHPDDPANKYLLHYAAESPEVINFYRGTAVLDGGGEAVVELPHYFAKINKTPSYVLTAVGAPMPMLHVAEEIDEAALSAGAAAKPGEAATLCRFRVAGGAPGGKVSWRVEAVRNDRWVQRRGAPVEVEKQDPERGTYLHPDLYGQPAEKGMNHDPERTARTPGAE